MGAARHGRKRRKIAAARRLSAPRFVALVSICVSPIRAMPNASIKML
jgi:hypothetical protein